jgi:hypothetical protein
LLYVCLKLVDSEQLLELFLNIHVIFGVDVWVQVILCELSKVV